MVCEGSERLKEDREYSDTKGGRKNIWREKKMRLRNVDGKKERVDRVKRVRRKRRN